MDEAEEEAMIDLEARAREFIDKFEDSDRQVVEARLVEWSRRLVAESRAGALREAAELMEKWGDHRTLNKRLDALAAESEPK